MGGKKGGNTLMDGSKKITPAKQKKKSKGNITTTRNQRSQGPAYFSTGHKPWEDKKKGSG